MLQNTAKAKQEAIHGFHVHFIHEKKLICMYIPDGFGLLAYYLLIETVNASEELAHGHIASGFNPLLWNKFRNASQEVKDPVEKAVTSKYSIFTTADSFPS